MLEEASEAESSRGEVWRREAPSSDSWERVSFEQKEESSESSAEEGYS